MKKIFRFQYEPCSGSCYHPEPKFFEELRSCDREELEHLVHRVVKAHDRLCNDPNMRFGVDYDEAHGIYIASFVNNGTLDLFSSISFLSAVGQVVNRILCTVPESKSVGPCEYSPEHENLGKKILEAVGGSYLHHLR